MWGERQVSLLLRDLEDFFKASDRKAETYSLGTIVCDGRMGLYEILDGHQRLTTMDLILSEVESILSGPVRPRLITAYRYLEGQATAKETSLPSCSKQRNIIAQKLEQLKTEGRLESFRAFLLDRVVIQRVIIPLSGEISFEPQLMFEIVNLRGQKLTELDVIKSRLLSALDDSKPFDRALFDRFWCSVDERLMERCVDGFRIPDDVLKELQDPDHSALAMTLGEIVAEEEAALSAEGDEKTEARKLISEEDAVEGTSENSHEAPVDAINALTIAWELLKHLVGDDNREALSEVGLIDKFDGVVRNEIAPKDGADKNVWRLMRSTASSCRRHSFGDRIAMWIWVKFLFPTSVTEPVLIGSVSWRSLSWPITAIVRMRSIGFSLLRPWRFRASLRAWKYFPWMQKASIILKRPISLHLKLKPTKPCSILVTQH